MNNVWICKPEFCEIRIKLERLEIKQIASPALRIGQDYL